MPSFVTTQSVTTTQTRTADRPTSLFSCWKSTPFYRKKQHKTFKNKRGGGGGGSSRGSKSNESISRPGLRKERERPQTVLSDDQSAQKTLQSTSNHSITTSSSHVNPSNTLSFPNCNCSTNVSSSTERILILDLTLSQSMESAWDVMSHVHGAALLFIRSQAAGQRLQVSPWDPDKKEPDPTKVIDPYQSASSDRNKYLDISWDKVKEGLSRTIVYSVPVAGMCIPCESHQIVSDLASKARHPQEKDHMELKMPTRFTNAPRGLESFIQTETIFCCSGDEEGRDVTRFRVYWECIISPKAPWTVRGAIAAILRGRTQEMFAHLGKDLKSKGLVYDPISTNVDSSLAVATPHKKISNVDQTSSKLNQDQNALMIKRETPHQISNEEIRILRRFSSVLFYGYWLEFFIILNSAISLTLLYSSCFRQ